MTEPTEAEVERAKLIAERMVPGSSALTGLVHMIADIVRQVAPVLFEEAAKACRKESEAAQLADDRWDKRYRKACHNCAEIILAAGEGDNVSDNDRKTLGLPKSKPLFYSVFQYTQFEEEQHKLSEEMERKRKENIAALNKLDEGRWY